MGLRLGHDVSSLAHVGNMVLVEDVLGLVQD